MNYEDDWLFVTEALAAADKVITISKAGYYWKVNEDSKSHKSQFVPDMMAKYEENFVKFAKKNYKNVVYLNFLKILTMHQYFRGH